VAARHWRNLTILEHYRSAKQNFPMVRAAAKEDVLSVT